jgi:hypothetical protein
MGLDGRTSPSSSAGFGTREIRRNRGLIVSGIRCILFFRMVVANRRGRGGWTTFGASIKVVSAVPIAIVPTPSGPSAVSAV